MARKSGLGPQGYSAMQRAVETDRLIKADQTVHEELSNPAALDIESPGEEEIEANLDWYVFDSSRVNEAAYDPDSKKLFVNFVRPSPGQDEYVYNGVEANEWRNFRRSQSPGKFINRVLNSKNYQRVN